MMIQYLEQAGERFSNEKGEVFLFNDTTTELLYEVASHAKTGAFSTFKISSYPGNFLNAGQCIFAIDSTAGATWIGADAPNSDIAESSKVEFETVVRPIPQVDPENPKMISQGPSVCIFNKEDTGEVMAAWLFTQFLLTNEVQIAYSQTEGYAPVTEKAQSSEEYADYMSRRGEDNDLYYYVKLDATKLLLDNTENTFITAVFNGSASLRNAAGQLIENTVKSVRRKETVDEKYIDALYKDITSLYRLDQISSDFNGKTYLGEMPTMSVALICTLAVIWVMIIVYAVINKTKKQRKG